MISYYAGWLTLFIFLITFFIFYIVIKSSNFSKPASEVTTFIYGLRSKYFFFLIICIIFGLTFAFNNLPYNLVDSKNKQIVSVVAKKWLWQFKNGAFKSEHLFSSETENIELLKNNVVDFHVSSDDVNHGFGIYDSNGKLLGQVQAMPNHVHKISMVFEKPGIYQVLCMEYCGVGHHIMQAFFKVK